MTVKNPSDIHSPQFDLPKGQVAHDLALLTLHKQISGEEAPHEIFERYMQLLLEFSATVDEQTRYEQPHRKWMEGTRLGKSEFDDEESEP